MRDCFPHLQERTRFVRPVASFIASLDRALYSLL
jgi:hypothetical protein